MATLASDLIEATRSHLDSGSRPELNRLTTTMNTSVTSVVCDFALGSIVAGSSIVIGLETMYVWSSTGSTATVQRAMGGTVAAAHTAGDLIYVNPRWSAFTILRALNAELTALSSPINGLYRMRTVDLTYSAGQSGYDLTAVTDLLDVYDVRYSDLGGFKDWPRIRNWGLARNQSTTDFASGLALHFYDPAAPGRTVRVQYKAPFAELTALSSDVQTTAGLPASANDIPPLGAVVQLVAPREVKRAFTDSQPESRTAAEVPPGASRAAAAGLLALRQTRIKEEAARLSAAYPPLSRRSA
jgi:hypothetical protein